MTYRVDILNPKAAKLLQNLADMKLIAITPTDSDNNFLNTVKRLRTKARRDTPSLESITKEVEIVRAKRHAGKK